MRPRLLVLLAAAALAAAVPAGSSAGCGEQTIVFSRAGVFLPGDNWAGAPAVDTKFPGCAVGADTRYILPGATMVKVRYGLDLGPAPLRAHVHGLGLDRVVDLAQAPLAVGGNVMDGPWLPIDPAALGEMRVDVFLPGGGSETEVYRTVDR